MLGAALVRFNCLRETYDLITTAWCVDWGIAGVDEYFDLTADEL